MSDEAHLLKPRLVTHPRLPKDTIWTALGDITLLDAAAFVPVILSRSLPPTKVTTEIARLESAVQQGAVAVGGFISTPEKNAAKRLATLPGLRIIRLLPFPLVHYPLTPAARKRIVDGTTLILSGIPGTDCTLTRANCVRTNTWVLQLCETSAPETQSAVEANPTESSQPTAPATGCEASCPIAHPVASPTLSKAENAAPVTADDPAAIFL